MRPPPFTQSSSAAVFVRSYHSETRAPQVVSVAVAAVEYASRWQAAPRAASDPAEEREAWWQARSNLRVAGVARPKHNRPPTARVG